MIRISILKNFGLFLLKFCQNFLHFFSAFPFLFCFLILFFLLNSHLLHLFELLVGGAFNKLPQFLLSLAADLIRHAPEGALAEALRVAGLAVGDAEIVVGEEGEGEEEEDDDDGDVVVEVEAVPAGDERHLQDDEHAEDDLHRQSLNLVRIHSIIFIYL
jgi:hypothetical protein